MLACVPAHTCGRSRKQHEGQASESIKSVHPGADFRRVLLLDELQDEVSAGRIRQPNDRTDMIGMRIGMRRNARTTICWAATTTQASADRSVSKKKFPPTLFLCCSHLFTPPNTSVSGIHVEVGLLTRLHRGGTSSARDLDRHIHMKENSDLFKPTEIPNAGHLRTSQAHITAHMPS